MVNTIEECFNEISEETTKDKRVQLLEKYSKRVAFLRYLRLLFDENLATSPELVDVIYKELDVPKGYGDASLDMVSGLLYLFLIDTNIKIDLKCERFAAILESLQKDDARFFYSIVTKTYTPKKMTKKLVYDVFPNLNDVRLR